MKKYLAVILAGLLLLIIHTSFTSNAPDNKAVLGKLLFFDPILSKDRTISCGSCHKPEFAFADTSSFSVGVNGKRGVRNTPSAMNLSLQRIFFWDGRANSLEEQALAPIENPDEMNLSVEEAIARLNSSNVYREYFKKIFGTLPSRANLAESLAAFERTLETTDSPFDEWKFSNDSLAVTDQVKRGFGLFNQKAKCIQCHFGADFTTNEFRNIGLFNGQDLNDSGRAVISGKLDDIGKFKVASLRNIAVTGPYMHNGIFKSLKEVIDFYDDPGKFVPGAVNRDSLLNRPLGLTERDKKDLEAFLISLTDRRFSTSAGYE